MTPVSRAAAFRVVLPCCAGLALAGCVRLGFALPGERAAPASQVDGGAGEDGAGPAGRQCVPLAGPWQLAPPARVAGASLAALPAELTLSPDGLTLYFASLRDGSWDSFRAARTALDAAFGAPTPQTSLNTPGIELRFLLAPTGLTAYINADWPGGAGGSDVWIATRSATATPFTRAAFSPVPGINTKQEEFDPWVSTDGLRIYFSRGPDLKDLDLVLARRAAGADDFSAGTALWRLNSAAVDDNPTLTSDELVIVFASTRPGGAGAKDLWYALRTSREEAFSAPRPLPLPLGGPGGDRTEPWIHPTTCELFFVASSEIHRSRFVTP